MPTTDLRTRNIDDETFSWLVDILDVIEALDADAYARHMADDVELRLPDGAVLTGRDTVADALRTSWQGVASLTHHVHNVHAAGDQVVHESTVHVVATGGQEVITTSTSWIERNSAGLISAARIYG